jgi:hypothetical protein
MFAKLFCPKSEWVQTTPQSSPKVKYPKSKSIQEEKELDDLRLDQLC